MVSMHYGEPRGSAEILDEKYARERGIRDDSQVWGPNIRKNGIFTEIGKSAREEDLEEKLRVLFGYMTFNILVIGNESEVQGRGHAWRHKVKLMTLDELT